MILRAGIHACLFSMCLCQGILSSFAYYHTRDTKTLVYCISTFVVAVQELASYGIHLWFGIPLVWILSASVVAYAFFLASTLMIIVAFFTSISNPAQNAMLDIAFINGNFAPVSISLALFSAFLMGVMAPLQLQTPRVIDPVEDFCTSSITKSTNVDPKSTENYVHPHDASHLYMDSDLNSSYMHASPDLTPMSMQKEFVPEIASKDVKAFVRYSASGIQGYVYNPSLPVPSPKNETHKPNTFIKPAKLNVKPPHSLKNKDSEKTLAEYDASEELSMDLLVRASLAGVDTYDENIDNWMNTKGEAHLKSQAQPASEQQSKETLTGALKIKKLRSKKSLSNHKLDSLPTLQETISNGAESPRFSSHSSGSFAKGSISLSGEKSSQLAIVGSSGSLSRGSQNTCSSASSFHTSKTHRKSHSWSSSLCYSPTKSTFAKSSMTLKEICSRSPKKFLSGSRRGSNATSPYALNFPPETYVLQESPEFNEPKIEKPSTRLETSYSRSSFDSDMNDLDEITPAVPSWNIPSEPTSSIRNVSLEYWEANKNHWITGSGPGQSGPLVYTSSTIDAHGAPSLEVCGSSDTLEIFHRDTLKSISDEACDGKSTLSAPSLHTYRDVQDAQSRKSGYTYSTSEHTLYRPSTPPAQLSMNQPVAYQGSQLALGKNQFPYQSHAASKSEPASQETSPIRKMMGKLKMTGEPSNMHKHSSSLANSMISSTSGFSSKSGSPRKAIKSLFTRSLMDQGKRLSFSHASPPAKTSSPETQRNKASMFENNVSNVNSFNFGTKTDKSTLDKFWESEAADSDKSRVSSMPSAIIGEYDKEKWRTLKTLESEI